MLTRIACATLCLALLGGCGDEGSGFEAPGCSFLVQEESVLHEPQPDGGLHLRIAALEGREVLEFPFTSGVQGLSGFIQGEAALGVFEVEILSPTQELVHRAAFWEDHGQEGMNLPYLEPADGTWTLRVSQRRACGRLEVQLRP